MKFQFENVAAFMAMNGHGPYVWAAYAITFVAIAYLLINPMLQHRAFINEQQKLQQKITAGSSASTSVNPE